MRADTREDSPPQVVADMDDDVESGGDENQGGGRTKSRRELPEGAVATLRAWMLSPEHFSHPYPTPRDQAMLMQETGVSKKQLKNWFTNARRRIWKPLLQKQMDEAEAKGPTPSPPAVSAPVPTKDHRTHSHQSTQAIHRQHESKLQQQGVPDSCVDDRNKEEVVVRNPVAPAQTPERHRSIVAPSNPTTRPNVVAPDLISAGITDSTPMIKVESWAVFSALDRTSESWSTFPNIDSMNNMGAIPSAEGDQMNSMETDKRSTTNLALLKGERSMTSLAGIVHDEDSEICLSLGPLSQVESMASLGKADSYAYLEVFFRERFSTGESKSTDDRDSDEENAVGLSLEEDRPTNMQLACH